MSHLVRQFEQVTKFTKQMAGMTARYKMRAVNALSGQGAGGTGLPLPNGRFVPPAMLVPGVVLYPDEVELIQSSIDSMNSAIASAVSAAGGILVDIHAIFDNIVAEGYHIGGITLTNKFLTGGIFSADGFHPSSIGYSLIADQFVQALNAARGLEIPRPDLYGVLFTPNVPAPSGANVTGGGPWSYTQEMWQNLLSGTLSPRLLRMVPSRTPVLKAPQELGRPTRTLARASDD